MVACGLGLLRSFRGAQMAQIARIILGGDPSDKEEGEVKVKSQRAQKGFLASGHTIRVKSEKSEEKN
jgi:hypothetical protein